VNPRLPLPTAQVYRALAAAAPADRRPGAPAGPFADLESLVGFMRQRGNDLERPAIGLLPVIADIKAELAAQPNCRVAAMSGSGPTCFGIFADDESAARAAAMLTRAHASWWIVATRLGGGPDPFSSS